MGCFISVKADNGRDSQLFATLATIYGDQAMDMYLDIMANKSRYELDENGEPTFESISAVHSSPALFAPPISHSTTTDSGNYGPSTVDERFNGMIKVKQQLLNRQRKWIQELNAEINMLEKEAIPNLPKISTLYRLVHELEDRASATEDDISSLENAARGRHPAEKIFDGGTSSIVRKDMDRIAKLLSPTNASFVQNLYEAEKLIELYEAIGEFDKAGEIGHILFLKDEVIDRRTGNMRLTPGYRQPFELLAAEAKAHRNTLDNRLKTVLVNISRNNRMVRKTFEADADPVNFETLINFEQLTKAAPDLNALHSHTLDPTAGNPVLAQIMVNYIHEENETAWSEAKALIDRINDVVKAAEKELPKGIGGLGVRFDPFKQKYVKPEADGRRRETGHLITRFSADFEQSKRKLIEGFAIAIKDAQTAPNKKRAIAKAYEARNRWYKANLVLLDPNRISTIAADPKYALVRKGRQYSAAEIQAHEDELIRHLGSRTALDEYVHKSRKQLNQYMIQYEIVKMQISQSPPGSIHNPVPFTAWTQDMRNQLEYWELQNNPFLIPDQDAYVKTQKFTLLDEYIKPAYERFAVSIPRRYASQVSIGRDGKYVVTDDPSGRLTPWYDPDFAAIENNPALFDFYKTMMEVIETVNKSLPPHLQRLMGENSLIAVQKSILEAFISDGTSYLEALSVVSGAGVKFMDFIRQTVAQNQPDEPIVWSNPVTGEIEGSVNASFIGSRQQEIDTLVKMKVIEWEQNNPGQRIPLSVKSAFERDAQDQVAQKYSFDVTKILQMYAVMGFQYAHREKVVPVMNILKKHYTNIQKPKEHTGIFTLRRKGKITPGTAETMLRARANEQMEDWYKRAVLGDYTNLDQGKIESQVYTSEEDKAKVLEIDNLIANETRQDKIEELQKLKAQYLRKITASGVADLAMHALRIKGMGWNLPAVPNNIMAGTVSNLTLASDGRTVSWESIWRAYRIVLGNSLKSLTFDRVSTPEARKNTVLMDRYRVLQDATDEFQKAGQASKVTSKFDPLNPYEPVRRGEFVNQSVLMMGILMDAKITGNNGEQSTVWDALQEDGTLKPEFDNQANRENWVEMKGPEYRTFKVNLNKAIVIAHGDYDNLRGMSGKREVLWRMVMMFRTWLPRAFYTRAGGVQTDIELGYVTKGRYRSYTPGSASVAGAIMGSILLPGVGAVVGGAAGYGLATFFGVRSNTSLGEEIVFTTKQLIRKLMFKSTQFDQRFTEVDAANMRANLTELVMITSLFTAFLLTKMVLWDDDDEKDDPKRKAHNLLVNYSMRMMSDIMMFTTPQGYLETEDQLVPLLGLVERYGDWFAALYKLMAGQDTIPTGYNAGESRFINATERAFLPNIFVGLMELDPSLGFSSPMKMQYKKTPWDQMFYSQERLDKNERQRETAKKRKEEREE